MSTIMRYQRENGEIGIRNHLLIIPTVICANQVCSTPTGSAVVPVIKITGNKRFERMEDNMDVDVSDMLSGKLSLHNAGERIWQEIKEVADGKWTKAELLGHQEFSINRIGSSL